MTDKEIAELLTDTYDEGFRDGLMFWFNNMQKSIEDLRQESLDYAEKRKVTFKGLITAKS